jgi:hypothetical protein
MPREWVLGITREGGVDPHDELVERRHVAPQELGRGLVRHLALVSDHPRRELDVRVVDLTVLSPDED